MIEIFNFEQGSDEWRRARAGVPTASEFELILARGKNGGASKTRKTYMLKLIGERMTGEPAESYTNAHMERGKVMEDEARNAYAFITDNSPTRVGFVRNGDIGCSPDSLIADSGTLEIKTKLPHLQLEVLLSDQIPAEHVPQVQGQMMVCEREWCDFVSYWPKLPVFVKRAYRDEEYIKNLRAEIDRFLDELNETMAKINQKEAA